MDGTGTDVDRGLANVDVRIARRRALVDLIRNTHRGVRIMLVGIIAIAALVALALMDSPRESHRLSSHR